MDTIYESNVPTRDVEVANNLTRIRFKPEVMNIYLDDTIKRN